MLEKQNDAEQRYLDKQDRSVNEATRNAQDIARLRSHKNVYLKRLFHKKINQLGGYQEQADHQAKIDDLAKTTTAHRRMEANTRPRTYRKPPQPFDLPKLNNAIPTPYSCSQKQQRRTETHSP